jgi:RNA-binding protein
MQAITSKQRAYLRRLANDIDPIFQIGKSGVTPEVTEAISDALEARELIKINVLKNCLYTPKDVCLVLAERTRSNVVQQIGRKIVLYREAKEDSHIELP